MEKKVLVWLTSGTRPKVVVSRYQGQVLEVVVLCYKGTNSCSAVSRTSQENIVCHMASTTQHVEVSSVKNTMFAA
uniref:Uncharacterized protein n=1 Tax=Arundo donax TaxID=35708 RepID=A0A0A8YNQ5_ARUDO